MSKAELRGKIPGQGPTGCENLMVQLVQGQGVQCLNDSEIYQNTGV